MTDVPTGPFRRLHHICIVVHDIASTEAAYEGMGVGPWQDYPSLAAYTELDVPNRDAFLGMRYRTCEIDNVQLQLCQPPQADCPQRRHLDEKGEGVFHIGFVVPDCDAAEQVGRDMGLGVLMRGRRPDRTGFTYFDTAAEAGVVLLARKSPL
jgi:catechol 2,3-dioxygenase-like lactoylglutathione lyase family enzyme